MTGHRHADGSLIGCIAIDEEGRRLGTVIAVIHRHDGRDVLIERRRWLRRPVTIRVDGRQLVAIPPNAIAVTGDAFREATGVVRVNLAGVRSGE